MKMHKLSIEIARLEQGLKQVNIAQIKEILKILSILIFKNPMIIVSLFMSGKRHVKKEKKL